MIVENTSQYELRTTWNRHLKQDVLEVLLDEQWCALGSLVVGEQQLGLGLISVTTLPLSPSRSECDLQLAQTVIREGC